MCSKYTPLKLLLVSILALQVACASKDIKELAADQAMADKAKQEMMVKDSETSQVMLYNFFNKEDSAGTLSVKKTASSVESSFRLSWNNRKIEIDEVFTLGANGLPVSQSITGISAFGAPIEEEFTLQGNQAVWKSLDEKGDARVNTDKYYVPINGTGASTDYLIKALINEADNEIEMLPSGKASLVKLDKLTLDNGIEKKTVQLIGLVGFGFTPNFNWYDENHDFFGSDDGGWFGVIREGWTREHLAQLSELQKKADNNYLKTLAQTHINTIQKPILVSNANFVDVLSGELKTDQYILIENGMYKSISSSKPKLDGVLNIDAMGKTLIPGLWDMHGHIGKSTGLLNIPAGVTNVRDMGGVHDALEEIIKLTKNDELLGSDVYRAGFMDRESPYAMKMGQTIDSLENAKKAIDWYAERGYPQIKTYSSMEPEWIKPIAEHIHNKGMRLSGHIPAFMTAEEAVNAGFDEIQHINMLFLNFLGNKIDTRKRLRFTLLGEKAHELDLESKEVKDFLSLLKSKNITVDPTISTFRSLLLARAGVIDPEYVDIYDHLPATVARGFKSATMDVKPEEDEAYRKSADAMLAMVKKVHDAGIDVVAGTDAFPGFAMHRELILYSQAGISNAEVLKLATIGSAKIVGQDAQVGSISLNKRADLVFIDGNPLEDIKSLGKVALVIKGQNIYKPDEIYSAIGVEPFTDSVDF